MCTASPGRPVTAASPDVAAPVQAIPCAAEPQGRVASCAALSTISPGPETLKLTLPAGRLKAAPDAGACRTAWHSTAMRGRPVSSAAFGPDGAGSNGVSAPSPCSGKLIAGL